MKKRVKIIIEYSVLIFVFVLFYLLVDKYIFNKTDGKVLGYVETKFTDVIENIDHYLVDCTENQIKINVDGGYVCREIDVEDDIYTKIFDTYPISGEGKEAIYNFLDEGDVSVADNFVDNKIDIERYEPVEVDTISWDEDPYGDRYWRFLFYSLRHTRHLLYAYKSTGDSMYLDKLVEIVEGFVNDGIDADFSWDDYHAVAFRAMVLTNTWWKLREENVLTIDLNKKILKAIEKHGDFLLDEDHFEATYNHGINQSAALLLLGVNFPELDKSGDWLRIGEQRMNDSLDGLIDGDGILIENSPYYHFYVLEKYWVIHQYYIDNNLEAGDFFEKKLDKMILYATHILQPNLKVPLMGASLDRSVGNKGVYTEIAKKYPDFMYVLTQGMDGIEPQSLNKYYKMAGQVIMRSDWSEKTKYENEFREQTHLVFDVGPYRTNHSDLDALNINLYSNGETLITDTGLYTYDNDDEKKEYFHGTRGHNTVVVDGQDQRDGVPIAGDFQEGDGYVSFTAQHDLYPQVFHQRGVSLVGHDLVVIVDRLVAKEEHDYEQLFHLYPGFSAREEDDSVIVQDTEGNKKMTIKQLDVDDMEVLLGDIEDDPENNLCSLEYNKTVPCQTVNFKKHSKNTDFITLIKIGDSHDYFKAEMLNSDTFAVHYGKKSYVFNINSSDSKFIDVIQDKYEFSNEYDLHIKNIYGDWTLSGDDSDSFELLEKEGKVVLSPKEIGHDVYFPDKLKYEANVNGDKFYSIDERVIFDIPWKVEDGESYKVYEQEDFLPILGYHNIVDDGQEIKDPELDMYVSDFDKQIDYLTNSLGCRWYTFGDLMENYVLQNKKVPVRACAMNFDDGRENHFTNAYRIFNKYGAVATFYIIADWSLSEKRSYMGLVQLDELYNSGNEIGSHTVSASSLVTDGYDHEGLVYQISEAKKMLEKQGYNIRTFAYPRGEQDEQIVDIVSKYYIAGRDTSKDNKWRDRRVSVVNMDDDFIWHMNYYKPELATQDELKKEIWYNSFWQFEEGYSKDVDWDGDARTLSSYKPTKSSYGVVSLPDVGDKISNKFIVSKDGTYTLELFMSVDDKGSLKYADIGAVRISVDDEFRNIVPEMNDECLVYHNQFYCYYNVEAVLDEGVHVLSVQANVKNIKLDKFRMYREENINRYYDIKLTEYKGVLPKKYPDNLDIKIIKGESRLFTYLAYLLPSVLFLLILFVIFLRVRKNKRN